MTEQEQFKACAELDGVTVEQQDDGLWTLCVPPHRYNYNHGTEESAWSLWRASNNYSTRDALVAVIEKHEEVEFNFSCELKAIIARDLECSEKEITNWDMVTSTPAQLREALLRATRKWKES